MVHFSAVIIACAIFLTVQITRATEIRNLRFSSTSASSPIDWKHDSFLVASNFQFFSNHDELRQLLDRYNLKIRNDLKIPHGDDSGGEELSMIRSCSCALNDSPGVASDDYSITVSESITSDHGREVLCSLESASVSGLEKGLINLLNAIGKKSQTKTHSVSVDLPDQLHKKEGSIRNFLSSQREINAETEVGMAAPKNDMRSKGTNKVMSQGTLTDGSPSSTITLEAATITTMVNYELYSQPSSPVMDYPLSTHQSSQFFKDSFFSIGSVQHGLDNFLSTSLPFEEPMGSFSMSALCMYQTSFDFVAPTVMPSVAPSVVMTVAPTVAVTVAPSTALPTEDPTAEPTLQMFDVVSFDTNVRMNGASSNALDEASERSFVRTFAQTLGVPESNFEVVGTNLVQDNEERRRLSVRVGRVLQDETFSLDVIIRATLNLVDFQGDYSDGDAMFEEFKAVLTDAVTSGSFGALLTEIAAELGGTVAQSATISQTIQFSDLVTIAPPTFEPTKDPNAGGDSKSSSGGGDGGLEDWQLALIVVGGVLFLAAVGVGLVFLFSSRSELKKADIRVTPSSDQNAPAADAAAAQCET